jgi:hypothetical protein
MDPHQEDFGLGCEEDGAYGLSLDDGFHKSLSMIPLLCAASRASAICRAMSTASSRGSGPRAMRPGFIPPHSDAMRVLPILFRPYPTRATRADRRRPPVDAGGNPDRTIKTICRPWKPPRRPERGHALPVSGIARNGGRDFRLAGRHPPNPRIMSDRMLKTSSAPMNHESPKTTSLEDAGVSASRRRTPNSGS